MESYQVIPSSYFVWYPDKVDGKDMIICKVTVVALPQPVSKIYLRLYKYIGPGKYEKVAEEVTGITLLPATVTVMIPFEETWFKAEWGYIYLTEHELGEYEFYAEKYNIELDVERTGYKKFNDVEGELYLYVTTDYPSRVDEIITVKVTDVDTGSVVIYKPVLKALKDAVIVKIPLAKYYRDDKTLVIKGNDVIVVELTRREITRTYKLRLHWYPTWWERLFDWIKEKFEDVFADPLKAFVTILTASTLIVILVYFFGGAKHEGEVPEEE